MAARDTYELDLFGRSSLIGLLHRISPAWTFWIVLVAAAVPAIIVSWVTGTLGNVNDIRHAITDIGQAFGNFVLGREPSKKTPSDYNLLRDSPSILFCMMIAATASLVSLQWSRFSNALQAGVETGALRPRADDLSPPVTTPSGPGAWRFGLLDFVGRRALRPLRSTPLPEAGDRLELLVKLTNDRLTLAHCSPARRRWNRAAWFALAVGLAVGVEISQRGPNLFSIIAPPDSPGWSERTYEGWWASIENPAGALAYGLIACTGIYLIVLQNIGGFHAVRLIAALPSVAELDVDWLNTDEHHGWNALRRAYQTVILSLVLHGSALSLLVFIVGFRLPVMLLVPLVILWLLAALAYVLVPRWALLNVYNEPAERRVLDLRSEFEQVSATTEGAHRTALEIQFREQIEAVHRCRFTPLIGRRVDKQLLVVSVTLPVALTLIQIVPSL